MDAFVACGEDGILTLGLDGLGGGYRAEGLPLAEVDG